MHYVTAGLGFTRNGFARSFCIVRVVGCGQSVAGLSFCLFCLLENLFLFLEKSHFFVFKKCNLKDGYRWQCCIIFYKFASSQFFVQNIIDNDDEIVFNECFFLPFFGPESLFLPFFYPKDLFIEISFLKIFLFFLIFRFFKGCMGFTYRITFHNVVIIIIMHYR